ncbi:MAG: hypothetical protein H6604_05380 [Flavobacteriales bacterium]|nr:hypothetical protein [Flavobacteriales bacterium]
MVKKLFLLSFFLFAIGVSYCNEDPLSNEIEVQQYETAITPDNFSNSEEFEELGGGGANDNLPIDNNIALLLISAGVLISTLYYRRKIAG